MCCIFVFRHREPSGPLPGTPSGLTIIPLRRTASFWSGNLGHVPGERESGLVYTNKGATEKERSGKLIQRLFATRPKWLFLFFNLWGSKMNVIISFSPEELWRPTCSLSKPDRGGTLLQSIPSCSSCCRRPAVGWPRDERWGLPQHNAVLIQSLKHGFVLNDCEKGVRICKIIICFEGFMLGLYEFDSWAGFINLQCTFTHTCAAGDRDAD